MEVEDGGNTGWAAIATCHFTRLIFFFALCEMMEGTAAKPRFERLTPSRRITWIRTTRLLMGIHIHLPLPKDLLWGCRCGSPPYPLPICAA